MRSTALLASCPHLGDPAEYSFFSLGRKRFVRVKLDGGDTRVEVRFCRTCAQRLGANDGDTESLRLAALTVLEGHLQSRLARIIDGLREIVPLLSDARSDTDRFSSSD